MTYVPGGSPPPDVDVPPTSAHTAGVPIPDGYMVEVTTDNYMVRYMEDHLYTFHNGKTRAPHIDRAFLFVTHDGYVFGGAGLVKKTREHRVKWFGMVPEHRRHGNGTAALRELTNMLGRVVLDTPKSDEMRAFLTSQRKAAGA